LAERYSRQTGSAKSQMVAHQSDQRGVFAATQASARALNASVFIRLAYRAFAVPNSYAADIETGHERRSALQDFAANLIHALVTIKRL
jgi:hypothetical protein